MKSLIVTAPDPLRSQLRELGEHQLVAHCATRRPDRAATAEPTTATLIALRALPRRHQQLTTEISELDTLITPLVTQINPALCTLLGVGPDTAGQLLVTAGDNPQRLRSEAAFAMLCGAAPLPASSGRTERHRLNRGDRQANYALYRIVPGQLCALPDSAVPATLGPPHPRLRPTPHHVGHDQERDHPLPQTLRRPRGLHRPARPHLAQPRPFLRPGRPCAA
jgi:Transposase IS116/IS110/IS902 family